MKNLDPWGLFWIWCFWV